jgi:hypothetical protein
MKTKLAVFLLAATAAAVAAGSPSPLYAQSAPATAQTMAGTWEGKQEGVPSVVLRITETGNATQGQVDFYILKKVDDGAPINAGKMTTPMVNPHIQGNALDFQIVRENRNGGPADKTVFNFALQPTGDRSATLIRTGGGEEGLEVEMSRVQ